MKKILILVILILFPINVSATIVTASSACLMEIDSNRILYEINAHDKRLIASITKIMTAVLAIESNRLNEIVTVGQEVLTMYGSNIYIELNEQMLLIDLLYGLLLRSGNDAAVVIATFIAGSEEKFVEMMNEKAKELGMNDTVYHNSHGLDEETQNYSTAYDQALLSSYAFSLKDYREITATKKYYVSSDKKSYVWHNRNKLLSLYEYATGGKTGYTPKAGRTLVTNASKGNLNLTAVTLNDGNEYNSHKNMYGYGFNNYDNFLIINKNNFKISKNYFNDVLYINNNFTYPLTEEEQESLLVKIKITETKKYQTGDIVGKLEIVLNKEKIYEDFIYVKVINKKTLLQKIFSFFK